MTKGTDELTVSQRREYKTDECHKNYSAGEMNCGKFDSSVTHSDAR